MFLTSQVELTFGDLGFVVNVPNNEQITAIYQKSQEIFKKSDVLPSDFSAMAEIVTPCLAGVPDIWESLPDISKDRLLFEIAKFLINESLTVPELKKK